MEYILIAMKDNQLHTFTRIIQDDHSKEVAAKNFARTIQMDVRQNPENVSRYEGNQIVCFGTFDDETGKFSTYDEPEIILECDKVFGKVEESN